MHLLHVYVDPSLVPRPLPPSLGTRLVDPCSGTVKISLALQNVSMPSFILFLSPSTSKSEQFNVMELSAIHWSYKFPSAPPLPACNGPTTLTEEEQVQLHAGAHDGPWHTECTTNWEMAACSNTRRNVIAYGDDQTI